MFSLCIRYTAPVDLVTGAIFFQRFSEPVFGAMDLLKDSKRALYRVKGAQDVLLV
jgi:hypothetical protein